MNQQDLNDICKQLALGPPEGTLERVYGGLIHKMWHTKTTKGAFAIKELSALIKFDDETKKSYERSEEIATKFCQAGIPAIAALSKNGHYLIELKNSHFLCYPWFDGKTLTLADLKKEHLVKIAKVLAQIHQVSLQIFGCQQPKYQAIIVEELGSLLEKAGRADASSKLLLEISQRYKKAIQALQKTGLISHTDLDPKNVMWDAGENPFLIDWESARAINSTHDVIQMALDFSGLAACSINFESFRCMLQTYQGSGGHIDRKILEDVLFAILGNSLNWLAFNIKRSIDLSISQDERQMAIMEVSGALKCIVYLHDNLLLVDKAARI